MDFNDVQKDFLTKIGMLPEVAAAFVKASEDPESFNAEEAANAFISLQRNKYFKNFKETAEEDLKKEAFGAAFRKANTELNKTFDLGLSNEEIREAKLEDLIAKAQAKIQDGATGDEALKEMNKKLQKKLVDIVQSHEQSVQAANEAWEKKYNDLESAKAKIELDTMRSRVDAKLNWGIDATFRDLAGEKIFNAISGYAKINPDGTIVDPKTGGPVLGPDGMREFKTYEEAANYHLKEFKYAKVSGGGDPEGSKGGLNGTTAGDPGQPKKVSGFGMNIPT